MDRRSFVALLTSASLGAAQPAPASALPVPEPSSAPVPKGGKLPHRPNVVFMICDDLGFGDLSCYGSKLPTPNLDAMAAAGMRFVHHNSAHPICSASRASVLTGRYGLRMNTSGAFGPTSQEGTSRDETLLSELFLKAGYSTKAIGK